MESKKDINLEEYVDQRRWLLNNGLITDDIKNQLFLCGSIVHKEVQAVELDLDLNNEQKVVHYTIYVEPDLLKKIAKYEVLSKSTSLLGMWRFKRLLKKEGALDFQQILAKFVTDYCGPKWSVTVKVVDFNTYIEGLGDQSETEGQSRQHNQLPD